MKQQPSFSALQAEARRALAEKEKGPANKKEGIYRIPKPTHSRQRAVRAAMGKVLGEEVLSSEINIDEFCLDLETHFDNRCRFIIDVDRQNIPVIPQSVNEAIFASVEAFLEKDDPATHIQNIPNPLVKLQITKNEKGAIQYEITEAYPESGERPVSGSGEDDGNNDHAPVIEQAS